MNMNKLGIPFFALAVASAVLVGGGCHANSPSVNARAVARGAVETLESSWMAAAKACVATASANDDQALLDQCKSALDPARDALIAAAEGVNAWTSADQNNYPCLIGQAAKGVSSIVALLKNYNVSLPPVVQDGLDLAAQFTCVATMDGGAE